MESTREPELPGYPSDSPDSVVSDDSLQETELALSPRHLENHINDPQNYSEKPPPTLIQKGGKNNLFFSED